MDHPRGLVVGSHCQDVLIRNDTVLATTLGGATSYISSVLDSLSIQPHYVSKVGPDFSYRVTHPPIIVPSSQTTLFHAHFLPPPTLPDRILKRVRTCDPIFPYDLPDSSFHFGLVAGVAGEVPPETLQRIIETCHTVFVDIQSLIRVFDLDGTVGLVDLKRTGYFDLISRVGFLKASAEEEGFVDVEEVRRLCCIVVTNGEEGCRVVWRDGEVRVAPFKTVQVDPTGAGDSFMGGLIYGLVRGLSVPDSALLGNFFGSLAVSQVGLPKFDHKMMQRVEDVVQRRVQAVAYCHETRDDYLNFAKPSGHEKFHASLSAAKLIFTCAVAESKCDLF